MAVGSAAHVAGAEDIVQLDPITPASATRRTAARRNQIARLALEYRI